MRFYNLYGQLTISIRLIRHVMHRAQYPVPFIPTIPTTSYTARFIKNPHYEIVQRIRRRSRHRHNWQFSTQPNYTRIHARDDVLDTRNVITRQTETLPPLPSRHATVENVIEKRGEGGGYMACRGGGFLVARAELNLLLSLQRAPLCNVINLGRGWCVNKSGFQPFEMRRVIWHTRYYPRSPFCTRFKWRLSHSQSPDTGARYQPPPRRETQTTTGASGSGHCRPLSRDEGAESLR